jgi:hypothetical protein
MALGVVLLQGTAIDVANQPGSYYGTFWFALALINAGLAQLQGRRGLNWFLLSLLLGPVATLILVVQYKKS